MHIVLENSWAKYGPTWGLVKSRSPSTPVPGHLVEPLERHPNLQLLVWIFTPAHIQLYVLLVQGDIVYILNGSENCQIVLGAACRTREALFLPSVGQDVKVPSL